MAKRAAKAVEKEEDQKAYRAVPDYANIDMDGVYRWSSDGVDHEYSPLQVKYRLAAVAKAELCSAARSRLAFIPTPPLFPHTGTRAEGEGARRQEAGARRQEAQVRRGNRHTRARGQASPPLDRHVLRGKRRGSSTTKRKRGWEAQAS